MKLGSHNTMSYLRPLKWYMRPFAFIARCQSKSIQEQIEKYGIEFVDLRVKFVYNKGSKYGKFRFAHGAMIYKGDVLGALVYINSLKKNIGVRLLLEITKPDEEMERDFIAMCEHWELLFRNIKFCCGRRKYDWKQIYEFKNQEPSLDDKYSSMTWKIWDDWFPWIYARFMNKRNLKNGTDKDYMFFDFVNIR